ncbi:hypothetical protein AB0H49_32065 [Nocardia sp. NPDC050713]|uniref:hypothetical protein n=1 Tax=Nocardia sp. NPDC050713 TaxID=3154511 RepID=UPI0033CEA151
MALNFKLGPKRDVVDSCVWGRTWVGWEEGQSDNLTYKINRGVWKLGPRAAKERYATFSYDGIVRAAVEVDHIEDVDLVDGGVKQAVVARVLESGDAAYEMLVGRTVDAFRNPVTYIPDELGAPRQCECGCGTAVSGGRQFVPGHDQRAIHNRIREGWGTTVDFIRWFDSVSDHRNLGTD